MRFASAGGGETTMDSPGESASSDVLAATVCGGAASGGLWRLCLGKLNSSGFGMTADLASAAKSGGAVPGALLNGVFVCATTPNNPAPPTAIATPATTSAAYAESGLRCPPWTLHIAALPRTSARFNVTSVVALSDPNGPAG